MDWRDALILYGGAAIALASTLLAVGVASDSRLGIAGALLTTAGVLFSWRTSRWPLPWAVLSGLVLGSVGALLWVRMVAAVASVDETILGGRVIEIGMAIAVPMGALMILLSFLMVRGAVVGFAMVPALSAFGLISGRVDQQLEQICFMVFLPAALIAVGWVMVLPGEEVAVPESRIGQWRLGQWRVRHWWTLAGLIALVLGTGYLISAPITMVGEAYRWQIIGGVTPQGGAPAWRMTEPPVPESIFRVGAGPVVLRDVPILAVSGPGAEYWRGLVFDQYTGSAWLRSQLGAPVPVEDMVSRSGVQLSLLDLSRRGTRIAEPSQTHHVRVLMDMPFVIYSPGPVQRVVVPLPTLSARSRQLVSLSVDPFGAVELPGGWLPKGRAYDLVSVPLPTAEGLAAPLARPSASEPASRASEAPTTGPGSYLAVPLSASRVADLAKRVAGGMPTPERKLAALVSYLQRNYVYDLNAPAVPRRRDAADYFLFRQKRGYCDLFATSLALMARAVGIPTRLVTGFLEGPYDEKQQAWVLRDADRHAWVEAYLPSADEWVTVDATSGVGDMSNRPRGLYLAWLRVLFFWQDHPFAACGIALAVLALAFYGVVRLRRLRAGAPPPPSSEDARAVVLYAYWRFLRLLRRFGHPRRLSQTPLEYLTSLEIATGPAAAGLPVQAALPAARSLTNVFLFARYSPGPVTFDEANSAQALVREIAAALRGRRTAAQQATG
jgi:transglutaminase-like putative cysteine protease